MAVVTWWMPTKEANWIKESGLGIFGLSTIIVDKAEPSEALKANVVWSIGLEGSKLTCFRHFSWIGSPRNNMPIEEETDIKGERGAYFSIQRDQAGQGRSLGKNG